MEQKTQNAYQKTVSILKNYNRISKSINYLEKQLDELKNEQRKLSEKIAKTNRVALREEDKIYYYTDETLENRINEITQLIIKSKAELNFINNCLSEIKHDEYYSIISSLYLYKDKTERKTIEAIAEDLNISTQSVHYNKNRLINQLSFLLVPLDKITEIKKIG